MGPHRVICVLWVSSELMGASWASPTCGRHACGQQGGHPVSRQLEEQRIALLSVVAPQVVVEPILLGCILHMHQEADRSGAVCIAQLSRSPWSITATHAPSLLLCADLQSSSPKILHHSALCHTGVTAEMELGPRNMASS